MKRLLRYLFERFFEKSIHYPYWWRRFRRWPRRYYDAQNPIYFAYWRWLMSGRY